MSDAVLDALLRLRTFLFEAVYQNRIATAEFKKTSGVLSGLWDQLRKNPEPFLDRRTIDSDGLDTAACDFIAGMTDRYAVESYERFFVPRPWVSLRAQEFDA